MTPIPGILSQILPHKQSSNSVAYYVPNVGLVLLHPFLPTFFRAIGWVEGDRFVDEARQLQAPALLHFLATGEEDAAEYDLLFAKFLCGIGLETPLPRVSALPETVRAEAERMLLVVVGHWSKLGSTSPDGLRNGFLRRPGKLTNHPFDGWLLQPEQSGLDVLLRFLPWGIGMLRLPWMGDLLRVEWE